MQEMNAGPTRRRILGAMGAVLTLAGCAGRGASGKAGSPQQRYDSFRPGQEWLDTSGKPIQAHGGSLIAADAKYYWYGENKEFTTGQTAIESWGIRFYASTDLYNWEDLGPIIPPDEGDLSSPLSPRTFAERPHMLWNAKTGKFVCWIKVRGTGRRSWTIMEANHITGPWTMAVREFRPNDMAAGDFDIVQDDESGRAFLYFEHDHKDVACIELAEDYLGTVGPASMHLPGHAPDSREGIACFMRRGKLYLTSSGLTGYFPNPTRVAVGSGPQGPFTDLGLLHEHDRTETSFGSQVSDIFKVPGKDTYIALADRWLPDLWSDPRFQSGEMSRLVRSAIAKTQAQPRETMTPDEKLAIRHAAALTRVNTSISRYVWLPLTFEGEKPHIVWHDEWKIPD